jgi:hypothetical protein
MSIDVDSAAPAKTKSRKTSRLSCRSKQAGTAAENTPINEGVGRCSVVAT